MKPIYYSQKDTKWKDIMYSSIGDKSQTIGTSGCGPSSMSMVAATLSSPKITPVEAASYALKNGYRTSNHGTEWAFFPSAGRLYGIDVTFASYEDALKEIKSGALVICNMGPGLWTKGGHYVLWYGLDGNQVLIHDPNSIRADKSKAPLEMLKAQCKKYIVCKKKIVKSDETEEEDTVIYKKTTDIPDWGKVTVDKLIKKKGIVANAQGEINLTQSMLRVFVAHDKMGMYE